MNWFDPTHCGCGVSRRRFLAGCAACAAGGGAMASVARRAVAADEAGKPKVRLIYLRVPNDRPIWPNIGYDFDARIRQLTAFLTEKCPGVQLLPVEIQSSAEAQQVVQEAGEVDGYVVYCLGLWTRAPRVVAAAGRPTIICDDLYGGSGEFLIDHALALRAGHKVVGVSSSRLQDVADAVNCFTVLRQPGKTADDFIALARETVRRNTPAAGPLSVAADSVQTTTVAKCLARLKGSTILCVGRDPGREGQVIEEIFGVRVREVPFPEIHQAYLEADRGKGAEWADQWIAAAEKVVEPARAEIEKSGVMHVAMCNLLERHHAQAITINCLGGFYGGHIQAYPCLGFMQLNNENRVGACEADLRSTVTMLAVGQLAGRPGYISDPVVDTAKNQIIYAHCVAMNRVFGPEGPANPYHIRNHSEDRQGAAIRSLMPLGYMTTTCEVHLGRRELIVHRAKAVENIDSDMACRTKLAAEVQGDIHKLLTTWDQWGWHRVTFYGDLHAPLAELSAALGLTLVEEA